MGIRYGGYNPTYGVGAPALGIYHLMPYYDTSTVPYTKYVFFAGGWHAAGVSGALINATQIQGINVKNAVPANGQVLTAVAANNDWEGV
jgi:hypothetical protein